VFVAALSKVLQKKTFADIRRRAVGASDPSKILIFHLQAERWNDQGSFQVFVSGISLSYFGTA
jgi:hypothetical protein